MNPRALAAALLALAVLPLIVATPASAAEDAVLTWPAVTRFNYETTPYVIHAQTQDVTGLDVRVNGGQPQPVSPDGDLRPRFVRSGPQVVEVRRCKPTCVQVEYRRVEAYVTFVGTKRGIDRFGPHRGLAFTYGVGPADVAATLTWSIVDPRDGDAVLAQGQDEIITSPKLEFGPVTLPEGTPDGAYELRRHLSGASEEFGTLDADLAPARVVWDATPDPGILTLSQKVLYPAKDGYRDQVLIGAKTDQWPELVVLDADQVVRARYDIYDLRTDQVYWRPRGVEPGRYTVRFTTTDEAGNVAVVQAPLQVRRGKVTWRRYTTTVTAKSALVRSTVGSCSTLASPAPGRPRGSLGYYSQTRCERAEDSIVSTLDSARVPRSFLGGYRDFRVSVKGGKARGTKDAYAVLYYYDARKQTYVQRTQLPPQDRTHAGRRVRQANGLVVDGSGKPRVYWNLGLTAGSRYDVTSFTVTVRYQVLA